MLTNDDDDLVDLLGEDVAETLSRESAIMSAALADPCPGCGAMPTPDLLGSRFDWRLVVEHAESCNVGGVPV